MNLLTAWTVSALANAAFSLALALMMVIFYGHEMMIPKNWIRIAIVSFVFCLVIQLTYGAFIYFLLTGFNAWHWWSVLLCYLTPPLLLGIFGSDRAGDFFFTATQIGSAIIVSLTTYALVRAN